MVESLEKNIGGTDRPVAHPGADDQQQIRIVYCLVGMGDAVGSQHTEIKGML